MRTEKCVPHGIVGWVLLEWTGADGMGALLCARQPRDEPAAGIVQDHEDSFSDEVVPEMGLEGWILERQDRSTLLVKAVAGARYRALWVAGFGDKSCPSVFSAIGRKRTMVSSSWKPLRVKSPAERVRRNSPLPSPSLTLASA